MFNINTNCFYEDGSINYLYLFIKSFIPYNLNYLSNIATLLSLIALFFKNKKYLNILNPLLITNGLFISVKCIFFLKKFDIEGLKYICPNDYNNPKEHNRILKLANQQSFIRYYKYSTPLYHFWLPTLIYYLGYTKNKNKVTNLIESLLVTLLIISFYGSFAKSDRYGFVIKKNTVLKNICFFIILHMIVTSLYFLCDK